MLSFVSFPKLLVMVFSFILLHEFTSAVQYNIVRNKAYNSGSPLHEQAVTSHRHCAQLCEATAACVAATYDRMTSSCQQFKLPLPSITQQEGNYLIHSPSAIGGNKIIFPQNISLIKINQIKFLSSIMGGVRTHDLWVTRQTPYPVINNSFINRFFNFIIDVNCTQIITSLGECLLSANYEIINSELLLYRDYAWNITF